MRRFTNTLQLRLLLALFFLALALPTAILVRQAYSQLKWEAFYQYRNLAEELSARITGRFNQLVSAEESRAFADYSFLVVSGAPARKCRPGMSAISTVGNAVEGFTRAIAGEIAPRRINVVSPGIIDTPMFPMEGEAREAFLQQASANTLLRRAGTADEVASGILFVIENDFVTGTTIDVDGGALLP